MVADADLPTPPPSGHVGYQVAADAAVEVQDQVLAECLVAEVALGDLELEALNAEGKVGCQLGIAEDAERGF